MPLHQIIIPTPLRNLTSQRETVEAAGSTIAEVIESLDVQFPSFSDRLVDKAKNRLRQNVLVYVNGEDVRFLADKETPVTENDEISILALSAGG